MNNKFEGQLLENYTGKIPFIKTDFSYIRSEDKIIFYFKAYNSSLFSYCDYDNGEIYNGDACEIFLDIGEENKYLEIEVAPNGKRFVANICNRAITFIDDDFLKTNVEIKGKDYFVTMEFDLNKLKNPQKMFFNAFRIETEGKEPNKNLLALNPTLCNTFHVREKFIELK